LGKRAYSNVTGNECSKTVEAYIKSNKMDIYFVPPHNHHVNAAKRAIATLKEHFIVGLATADRNCPLQLWDKFLHQVELTLSLLCFSRCDPNKSANKEVYGPYDFNKTHIAPIQTKSLVYNNPPSAPAGRCTELMHFTLALSPSIIAVCNSTCQPPNNVALQTHGDCTQAIAHTKYFNR
jgi:hypothetical protein